jgi:hypothetical protein
VQLQLKVGVFDVLVVFGAVRTWLFGVGEIYVKPTLQNVESKGKMSNENQARTATITPDTTVV